MLDLPYSARRQEAQLVYRQRRRSARRRAWLRNLMLGLLALGLLAAPGMATAMQRQHRGLRIDVRGAVLTLNPLHQGSGPVTLQVTLATKSGAPVAGVPVRIDVSGAVPFTGIATTNDAGIADLRYHAGPGPYTVRVMAPAEHAQIRSTVLVAAAAPVSTSPVEGRFYPSNNTCMFNVPADQVSHPAFTLDDFPTLNFGGPPFAAYSPVPGQLDVTAREGSYLAGLGRLTHFNAVLTGTLYVPAAGERTFTILVDDAYDFAIGAGAARISGSMVNPLTSGDSALLGLPILGAFNNGALQVATSMTVEFPRSGAFPYEVDYDECGGPGQLLKIYADGALLQRR